MTDDPDSPFFLEMQSKNLVIQFDYTSPRRCAAEPLDELVVQKLMKNLNAAMVPFGLLRLAQ